MPDNYTKHPESAIRELLELEAKATPGPWAQSHRLCRDGGYRTQVYDSNEREIASFAWHCKDPLAEIITTDRGDNSEFVATSRNTVVDLAREVLDLRERPYSENWIIKFEDPDKDYLTFTGAGAEIAARSTFQRVGDNWSCRLFAEVASTGCAPVPTTELCGTCAERFDSYPFSADHIFPSHHRYVGLPEGNCTRCGCHISEYNVRANAAVQALSDRGIFPTFPSVQEPSKG